MRKLDSSALVADVAMRHPVRPSGRWVGRRPSGLLLYAPTCFTCFDEYVLTGASGLQSRPLASVALGATEKGLNDIFPGRAPRDRDAANHRG